MKAITEAVLRNELRNTEPEVYVIPTGKILTPAAREYLQQRKIRFENENAPKVIKKRYFTDNEEALPESNGDEVPKASIGKYVDYESGAIYMEKPEHMTHLFGNRLVTKDSPRILFRGKLDSLQSQVVLAQVQIKNNGGCENLLADLGVILDDLREIMRADVLDCELNPVKILGLTHEELRKQSHNPQEFFGVEYMKLPDYTMGLEYALINQLRSSVREAEVAATKAYRDGAKVKHSDIIEELNRLSSGLHIMCCRYLSGKYSKGETV